MRLGSEASFGQGWQTYQLLVVGVSRYPFAKGVAERLLAKDHLPFFTITVWRHTQVKPKSCQLHVQKNAILNHELA